MPRNQGGAIVIEQPNPWYQALEGLGKGAGMVTQALINKHKEAKDVVKELTIGTATGKIPLEQMGSEQMESYLRQAGVWDHPEVQAMVARAKESMGYAAPPPVATQIPSAGPSADTTGGPAVNIPQPEPASPTSRQVTDFLQNKADVHALYMDQAKRSQDQIFRRQDIDYQLYANGAMIPPLPVQTKTARDFVKNDLHLDPDKDVDWSVTQRYGKQVLSYSMKNKTEAEINRELNSTDKRNAKWTDFETVASSLGGKRFLHTTKLGQILKAETITPEDLALEDADPTSAWYRMAVRSTNSKKNPHDRVIEASEQVDKMIGQINELIAGYNRVIQASGEEAGADQDIINSRRIQPLKFEDVTGGLTKQEFIDRKNGPSKKPDKLISEVRGDYRGTGITSPRPSEASSKSAGTKVQIAYNELGKTVRDAFRDNPDLSGAQVKSVLLGNKEQIMAEYGLNEKLFSLLMAMSDKVLG
jgi:hypothetical protein